MYISCSDICKFSYKCIAIIFLISIPVIVTEYVFREDNISDFTIYKHRYKELFDNKIKADVLILGNSHATYGIIPSSLNLEGKSSYNFSFNGAGPLFNYDLYNNYLRNCYYRPKLIIYTLSWTNFDSNRLGRRISQDYKYMPWSKAFNISDKFYITSESDILKRFINSIKNKYHAKQANKNILTEYDNGYLPNYGTYQQATHNNRIAVNDKTQISSLIELIKLIKQDNIQILLVETPEYITGRKSVSIEFNNNIIKKIANDNNIEFINYNDEYKSDINYNSNYFTDWEHLNNLGAQEFTSLLAKDIRKLALTGKIKIN